MPDWIIKIFAVFGGACLVAVVMYGVTIAVVRAVMWKKRVDKLFEIVDRNHSNEIAEIDKLKTRQDGVNHSINMLIETVGASADADIPQMQKEIDALWVSVDDLHKRLNDEEKDSGK